MGQTAENDGGRGVHACLRDAFSGDAMSVRGRHERGRDATASWRPPTRRKKIRYRGCRGVGAEERARAGALWISGRGAHHRVARAVARLRAESVRHLFCDGRGDVHVRPVLAVYGHPHRRERERHEERRGDGRAARATRSTADGDVAGVTHRQGRYERRVSARAREWPGSLGVRRGRRRGTFRFSAIVAFVGRLGAGTNDRRARSTSPKPDSQEKDLVRCYVRFSRTARVIWEPTGHLEGRELAFGAISPRAAPQEGTHARHSSSPGSTLRRSSTLASGSPARAQRCYVQRLDCLGRPHFLPTCAPPSQAVQRRRVQAHRPNRRYARVSCRSFPGAASVARPEAPRRFVVPKGHALAKYQPIACVMLIRLPSSRPHPAGLRVNAMADEEKSRIGLCGLAVMGQVRRRPRTPTRPNPRARRPTHHTTNHESARQKSPRKTRRRITPPVQGSGGARRSDHFSPRNPFFQTAQPCAPAALYPCAPIIPLFRPISRPIPLS